MSFKTKQKGKTSASTDKYYIKAFKNHKAA